MSMLSPFIFVSLLLFHGAICDWEEESDEDFALVRSESKFNKTTC